ncbi:serine hydrolase [Tuwongella immobilis]|uniref:Beta-lactamase-related domain-containing protein n=1 Tax=Tuwongella immobilis TaxID=692036 RepID=A0A6C2YSX0_9BACT|nr:serine hydrolase [Tuwongella immobilis]VIP04828.1 Beta-lactamase OS=Gemmatimonadetes bacterium KBS708 GN=J421_6089 PE=4 SV=1: Beta-lactamase: DUF3471 [Tuwongella immobilis]VTS07016.1 Beta-lactamase OS=Gemmatimonadetes bacterium KBS708 GN=J421_6089 PE=4 SV=1: Beta-lactamase: DUF3471 [Tuwongella immobilis]
MRRFAMIALILSLGIPHLSRGETPPAPPSSQTLATIIETTRNAWKVPGVAVVIVRDNTVIYCDAHGVRDASRPDPLTTDHVFPMASCSKAFTTMLLAMLSEEDKLRWDDSVRRHLPDFRLQDPQANLLVNVRDLVTHRAGLGTFDLLWYRAPWSTREMIARLGELPPAYPFRQGFAYQSVMVTAAGEVAAAAGGKPWAELVRERIFQPLEMTDAWTDTRSIPVSRRAVGHIRTPMGEIVAVPWYDQPEANAAGSVHLSANACIPWLKLLANRGTFAQKRLISESTFNQLRQPITRMPFSGLERALAPDCERMDYGLGWVLQSYRGHAMMLHGGTIDGFRTQITILPDQRLGIALLNNLHSNRMNQMLSNSLVDAVLGLPAKDWNTIGLTAVSAEERAEQKRLSKQAAERNPDAIPNAPLAAYTGIYRNALFGTARIELHNGRLQWQHHGFRQPLSHDAFDTFTFVDPFLGREQFRFGLRPDRVVLGVMAFDIPFERISNLPQPMMP